MSTPCTTLFDTRLNGPQRWEKFARDRVRKGEHLPGSICLNSIHFWVAKIYFLYHILLILKIYPLIKTDRPIDR